MFSGGSKNNGGAGAAPRIDGSSYSAARRAKQRSPGQIGPVDNAG
jgi:hypothetical protein